MVALLPDGVQLVAEVDLARLRANPVMTSLAADAFGKTGTTLVPGLNIELPASPLATAGAFVLAAYGVGTAQAATIELIATTADVTGATRITPEVVAVGPPEWVGQIETRAAIGGDKLQISTDLRAVRERAVPAGATGAIVRLYARLSFDARIALARMTNFDPAPAQLSLWADVADDFALVADFDVSDPGERNTKKALRRGIAQVERFLTALADVQAVKELGVPNSLLSANVRVVDHWVRTTITISPRHLARVVERARGMLATP
jgi:hypothetical protein